MRCYRVWAAQCAWLILHACHRLVQARQNEVLRAVAVLVGGAGRVLAAAQERLDRLEDAKRTLSESLQILGHPAAQLAHMPGALHLGQG